MDTNLGSQDDEKTGFYQQVASLKIYIQIGFIYFLQDEEEAHSHLRLLLVLAFNKSCTTE
jgi:hypothetical protein